MNLVKALLLLVMVTFSGLLFLYSVSLGAIGVGSTFALGLALFWGSRNETAAVFLLYVNFLLFIFAPVLAIIAFLIIGPGVVKLLTGRDREDSFGGKTY